MDSAVLPAFLYRWYAAGGLRRQTGRDGLCCASGGRLTGRDAVGESGGGDGGDRDIKDFDGRYGNL